MADERWQRVSRIYQEAVKVDLGARELYLRERCEGDESLIAELRSLLHEDSRTERLLERKASHVDLIGQRLGAYEVQSLIGMGGMGEVYRAHDTKLGRDVAIKILPAAFIADRERLLRFEREARVLATLNHPHIGAIYGVEERDGVRALVLEMVEGETLADHLARGPMPFADALRTARQIADALEAAHEKGIVHRDLKPANIKITPDGSVKVLDFGLAKIAQPSGTDLRASTDGVILGTAGYMSPEQACGKAVDKRSDIWAFGCVLYEMLTGRLAFGGDTISDAIAGILEREPEWRFLPEESPAIIRRLLKRCLEKEPKRRLHDIADARLDIDDALTSVPAHDVASGPMPARRTRVPIAFAFLCGIVLAGIGTFLYFRGAPAAPFAVRFVVTPADGVTWALPNATEDEAPNTVLAVSPNGRRVVYTGRTANGTTILFIRSLESLDSQPLNGTDGATSPFWSPDSRSVGFFADGKMKRIDASGGAATTLCEVVGDRGATWGDDGVIVFAAFPGPLQKVSAAGGVPTNASALAEGEDYHARPLFLLGSRHFIFRGPGAGLAPESGLRRSDGDALRGSSYYLGSLDSTERTPLFTIDSGNVVYSAGYLLFIQNESTLMAQPFDAERFRLTGAPIPVADNIRMSTGHRPLFGVFSASQTGTLVYLTKSGSSGSSLIWFDRMGRQLDVLDSDDAADPVLSEDGNRVMVTRRDPTVNTRDIWLIDVVRKTPMRLTIDPQEDRDVVWAPDGRRVVFASNRGPAVTAAPPAGGGYDLFQRELSGGVKDEVLLEGGHSKFPTSWSADGRFILYEDGAGSSFLNESDLWVLPLADRKPLPFIQSPQFSESQGQFSPDGRWVAYVSNESGTFEVYVAPFPGAETHFRVSTSGGSRPRWRHDGREIFFRSHDNKLMAAAVSVTGTTFSVGEVKVLFDNEIIRAGSPSYAVTADGQRFLVNTLAVAPMTVVLNWQAGLER